MKLEVYRMKKTVSLLLLIALSLFTSCTMEAAPSSTSPSALSISQSDSSFGPVQISVPYLSQEEVLPTGCEIVSAMMLLRFYGHPISLDEMLAHIPNQMLTQRDGVLYGPHPDQAFVGDPRTPNGYGCYPPVLCKALQEILGDSFLVKNTTGISLQALTNRYLSAGVPILLWATIDMKPTAPGNRWIIESTGEEFVWLKNEHCLVLTGYDSDYYYLNDPYNGNGEIQVRKELLQKRFDSMGKRSLVVQKLP